MDEMMTRLAAFLEQASTRKQIENIARSLSGQFQDHETEDIAQTVLNVFLKRKISGPRSSRLTSPWSLIRKIVTNHLRDRLLSSISKAPALYFRKRVVDCLRKAEKLHTFEFRRGKRTVICYTFRTSGILAPCHITEEMIRKIPFHDRQVDTGIKSINTEKGIIELAGYFLGLLEKKKADKCLSR